MPPGEYGLKVGHDAYLDSEVPRAPFELPMPRELSAPADPWAQHDLGVSLRQAGRRSEAEAALRRSIELNPTEPNHHSNLADLLGEAGRYGDGEAAIRRAIALAPKHAGMIQGLGDLLHRQGRLAEAETEYRRALDRVKAAVDARADGQFVVMARTDAAASEGLDGAVTRAARCVEAGADMIFAEALTTLDEYRRFTTAISAPVLANVTEFGKTPLLTTHELAEAGVRLALYPLSAFRAMSRAAERTYQAIRTSGTQGGVRASRR